jgi:hypothetical protein
LPKLLNFKLHINSDSDATPIWLKAKFSLAKLFHQAISLDELINCFLFLKNSKAIYRKKFK